MCVDQYAKHTTVSYLNLLLGIFVPTTSHFIFSYAFTRDAYDMVVQLSLTSTSANPSSFVLPL
ncbi:hypothetical protein GW17_00061865, partial [Ensete ventricosum]